MPSKADLLLELDRLSRQWDKLRQAEDRRKRLHAKRIAKYRKRLKAEREGK